LIACADEAAGLLQPPAHGLLKTRAVSRQVNAVRNNGLELLEAIA
jgi:putative SOS response-associated peptidase YedK